MKFVRDSYEVKALAYAGGDAEVAIVVPCTDILWDAAKLALQLGMTVVVKNVTMNTTEAFMLQTPRATVSKRIPGIRCWACGTEKAHESDVCGYCEAGYEWNAKGVRVRKYPKIRVTKRDILEVRYCTTRVDRGRRMSDMDRMDFQTMRDFQAAREFRRMVWSNPKLTAWESNRKAEWFRTCHKALGFDRADHETFAAWRWQVANNLAEYDEGYVTCPECGGPIPEYRGWLEVDEFKMMDQKPQCLICGLELPETTLDTTKPVEEEYDVPVACTRYPMDWDKEAGASTTWFSCGIDE